MKRPLVNIHTHHPGKQSDLINIISILPDQSVPDNSYYSVGIHPWEIENDSKRNPSKIKSHIKNKNLIAIGEIGLDKIKIKKHSFEVQKTIFQEQLIIAEENELPVIIHCVRAYSDILQVRRKYNKTPWIIHGFHSSIETAKQLVKNKCFLSFGPTLLKNEKSQELLKNLDLDHIFLETDDSTYEIEEIYSKAAKVLQMDINLLKEKIYHNFVRIFNV